MGPPGKQQGGRLGLAQTEDKPVHSSHSQSQATSPTTNAQKRSWRSKGSDVKRCSTHKPLQ